MFPPPLFERKALAGLSAVLVLLAFGCAGGGSAAGGDPSSCPPDQHRDATGTCVAGAALECEPGMMKPPGEATCTPIGWTDCGDGFEKDPSGWGCREVIADGCTGATRGALGQTTCVPVGDCSAAFPPPGATLFVSATGPTNATHFRSLESAALASRTGDVIAVDSGVYHESAQFDRAVTVVGRCAETVILDGTGLMDPGLIVDAPTIVRGVTLRGFPVAVQASAGIDLEDSVLDGNQDVGIYAEGTAITAKLARSVIRNTPAVGLTTAFGIDLALGTSMEIVDSEITGSEGAGIIVTPGSKVSITSSVIRHSTKDKQGAGGFGINGQGGDATISGSAFIDNADTGIRAYKAATFTVDRTVVRGTRPGDRGRGYGMVASTGSTLVATRVLITETQGVGIVSQASTATISDSVVRGQQSAPDGDFGDGVYVFNGGTLTLARVAILDNTRSGADIFDVKTEAAFDHVLLAGTKPLPIGDMGLGIAIAYQAHAKIDSSVIANNHHTGIYGFENGTLDLSKSAIRDTSLQLASEPLGHGILFTDSDHVTISDSEIRRSAGIGVALANTSANIARTVIADNAVGIHVQDGSTLRQVDALPDGAPTSGFVTVTADTQFQGNGTRIGSGTVPLPEPLPRL